MPVEKKYQIFISSTFADLKDHRLAAMNAVIDLRHIPIGMEGFPAIDQQQMLYITRLIDECDYYVLIVGERYGSKSPNGKSYTELEYDYASSSGKHVLAFLSAQFEEDNCDDYASLALFRERVAASRIVKFWTDKSALELAVVKSLSNAFEADPREGWVKASNAVDPNVLQELASAQRKISELETRLASNSPAPIPNLAGLDDPAVLSYEMKISINHSYHWTQFQTSWRAVFLAIAPDFRVGHTIRSLSSGLTEFLKLNGRDPYVVRFTDTELVRLLNQFELLGLMASRVSKSTSGSMEVFYRLTDRGEALRMSGLAVTTSS